MAKLPKLRLEIKKLKQKIEEEDLQIDLEKVFVNSVLHEKQNRRAEAYRKVHNMPHKDIKLEDPGELLLLCTQKHPTLPTHCPDSLAMLSYLVLAGVDFALIHDSHALQDLVPYVQYGPFIAFHGDKGGALQTLIEEKIIDLDNGLEEPSSINLKIGTEIVRGELANALTKELKNMGLVNKKRSAFALQKIYDNILSTTYKVLSNMLQDRTFFFGDRPTSLDALFLGHALFVLHVLLVSYSTF
ncbi:mitochondrial outer membrane import complex protein METAXIN-like [Quercus robur]|uniref:mitochondrial outer membrane import complex protein METAXIN-like n=1 Tax=Quercus robur TaxID=38942 RepID=UPI00216147E5|nr:mitochondrial outer membrane import complex protein METAXIN-like [Quercus robur]